MSTGCSKMDSTYVQCQPENPVSQNFEGNASAY